MCKLSWKGKKIERERKIYSKPHIDNSKNQENPVVPCKRRQPIFQDTRLDIKFTSLSELSHKCD